MRRSSPVLLLFLLSACGDGVSSPTPTAASSSPPSVSPPPAGTCATGALPADVITRVPEAHTCVHFEDGPVREVLASTEAASAPDVSRVHTRFDVTLQPWAGGLGGYVSYLAAEAEPLAFFFDAPVGVRFWDARGAEVCARGSADGEACPAFIDGFTVVDTPAGALLVELGPVNQAVVRLAVEDLEEATRAAAPRQAAPTQSAQRP